LGFQGVFSLTITIKPDKKKSYLELDIVVPLFNEGLALCIFHKRLITILNKLPYAIKVFYIDDGSMDDTASLLSTIIQKDKRVCAVHLSRNFGHQAALTAGLDLVEGDIVITMDGDGQHPPELIPTLIEHHRQGYDIVQTQRVDHPKTSFFKHTTANLFYGLINKLGNTKIIPGTADFRLMSRSVVLALREMTEYHRFIRGMVPWLGYRVFTLPYSSGERIAGKSKYTFLKMFSLAEDAIFSFSLVPLRLGLLTGGVFILLAFLEAIYVLTFWLGGKQNLLAPGWSSIVFLILITGGSLMIIISLVGIYIGQIHQEVKHRPIYIIRSIDHSWLSKSERSSK
jgi:glycosyltransferase involved in cell wall biosynthesis